MRQYYVLCGAVFVAVWGGVGAETSDRIEPGVKKVSGSVGLKYELLDPKEDSLWQKYHYDFTNRLSIAVERRLSSLKNLERNWRFSHDPTMLSSRYERAVVGSLTEGLEFGAEEALYNTSLGVWSRGLGHWFAEMMFGNTDERYMSIDSSEGVSQRWWDHAGALHYGMRPFRMEPYAFISLAPADYRGMELFKLHSRVYIRDLERISAESFLFVDVIHSWQLGVWYTYVIPMKELRGGLERRSYTFALRREFMSGTEVMIRAGDYSGGRANREHLFIGIAGSW